MVEIAKNNRGFTLVEIIISIAMFSIVSVVVLRLFVTSHQLNETLRVSDMSHVKVTNTIELIKSYDSLDDLLKDEHWFSINGQAISGSQNISQYLDVNEDYILKAMLTETNEIGLYNIQVKVINNEDEVISYNTKHYFKGERMEGF